MTRFLRGGSERNVAHSIAWELAAGFDVELAVGRDSDITGAPPELVVHRLNHLARGINPPRDGLAVVELRRLIRERRYDIVHTHQSKAGIVGRLAAYGVARSVAHTVHMGAFGAGYGRAASALYRAAERHCASRCDVIAFVGEELQDLYATSDVVPRDRTMVIRSPIDVEPLVATRAWTAAERRRVKQRLGIDPDEHLIVAIGALEQRKRYDLMLRKVTPLLRARTANLAIAGAGPDREALEGIARELEIASSVHFLGHVDYIAELLAAADVLVHTSSVEGVPQAVIQALAAGRPVVATEASGLREVPAAPVTVVGAGGEELDVAVRRTLDTTQRPAAEEELTRWTCRAIDISLRTFHERLERASR